MSLRRWAIILTFGIAAIAVLSLRWESPQEAVRSGRFSGADERAALAVSGGLDSNKIQNHESLHLWLVFHNRSQETLTGLRFVDFQMPGFVESGGCWVAHAPACTDQEKGSLAGELRAGASAVISADLIPAAGSGRYTIAAVYSWTNPAGGELRGALSLGPVEVTTWWREAVLNVSRRARAVTTQFALPVILLWAGWKLQSIQKQRDDDQKNAEDARSQRQAQITATLNTLLTGNLKDTQKYYLPFATRLSRVLRLLLGARAGGRDFFLFFHAFMLFLCQQKLLVDEIGGHHFQNRDGEDVVSLAWHAFFVHLDRRLPLEIRTAAFKKIHASTDVVDFRKMLDAERFAGQPNAPVGPLSDAQTALTVWLQDPVAPLESLSPLLEILKITFLFEINRPFEYWYGSKPDFPVEPMKGVQAAIIGNTQTEVERLKPVLQRYVEAGEKWQQKTEKAGP